MPSRGVPKWEPKPKKTKKNNTKNTHTPKQKKNNISELQAIMHTYARVLEYCFFLFFWYCFLVFWVFFLFIFRNGFFGSDMSCLMPLLSCLVRVLLVWLSHSIAFPWTSCVTSAIAWVDSFLIHLCRYLNHIHMFVFVMFQLVLLYEQKQCIMQKQRAMQFQARLYIGNVILLLYLMVA